MKDLTASLEDYLEVICNYTNNGASVRAIDISKELKVSRASVTEALKKLACRGYINYDKYDLLSLTESGKTAAENIVSKHNLLQLFFEKIIGLSSEEASENACRIEHVITENAFKQITDYTNRNLQ